MSRYIFSPFGRLVFYILLVYIIMCLDGAGKSFKVTFIGGVFVGWVSEVYYNYVVKDK